MTRSSGVPKAGPLVGIGGRAAAEGRLTTAQADSGDDGDARDEADPGMKRKLDRRRRVAVYTGEPVRDAHRQPASTATRLEQPGNRAPLATDSRRL